MNAELLDPDLTGMLLLCKKKTREDLSVIAQEITTNLEDKGWNMALINPDLHTIIITLQDKTTVEAVDAAGLCKGNIPNDQKEVILQGIPSLKEKMMEIANELSETSQIKALSSWHFYEVLKTLMLSLEVKYSN